jgi:hypothetical protein
MIQVFKFIAPIVLFSMMACSNMERMDTGKVKDAMESFKIKRVTPLQINEQVERMGSKISEAITQDFKKELNQANPSRKAELCELKNIKLIDSLSSTYHLNIHLLGQADLMNNRTLYAKEKEVLEAYVFDAKNQKKLSNNIQKIGDSLFVYTSPIDGGIGKMCYNDASDFAIWSIILKKSEVIKLIDTKK